MKNYLELDENNSLKQSPTTVVSGILAENSLRDALINIE